ncbi:MAG: class I SAM-dependent methyltransferase [Alkalispirochaeta sp.]
MSDMFWNRLFADHEFHDGTEVNTWVAEAVGRYVLNGQWFANLEIDTPDELRVIELAAGEGRNAVWLAEQGFQVTAFDQSIAGSDKTQRLATTHGVSLTTRTDDAVDLGLNSPGRRDHADVVVSTFFHVASEKKRAMFAAHRNLVRPGGLVIAEWFHPDQRRDGYSSGGPPDAEMMVTVPELRTAFGEWHILECRSRCRHLSEGIGHAGDGVVTQFAAQKPIACQ